MSSSEGLRSAAATGDRNSSAVHVHLTVANQVEPRPSEDSVTIGHIVGDLEIVGRLQRAAANDGLDHMERGTVVVAEGQLARAATMSSGTSKGNVVGLSSLVLRNGAEWGVGMVALAGEVRAWIGMSAWMPEVDAETEPMTENRRTIGIKGARHGIVNQAGIGFRVELAAERVGPAHLYVRGT